MKTCVQFLLPLLIALSALARAEDYEIRVNEYTDPNSRYIIGQLKNALSKIDTKYKLTILHENFTQARTNEEVKNQGLLNLCWTTSDPQIEQELRPIRIPILKGLLGYRILIINKKNQYKFSQVKTFEDLKQFTFGQGKTWTDTKILQANGLKVITTNKYPGLFHMVDGERFDAFPRGVNEPFGELAQRPDLPDLKVEDTILLVYRMPFYLFVSRDNPKLGNDIETGLNRAIADGSFDKIFYSEPNIKDVLEKANMKNRRIFNLTNPFLTKETPLDREELWFDPQKGP
ncbi:MAG TPA: transporter substrate-binding domain-containing protein [Cellvibrionaceae bacterium]|nr:transporter substrate-binding domain-containing protein [Cellvibrionaceae bacterium]HMW73013.1 transporter substrate-binding domain-containing protein [Cellvibrionaceae bacterium]HMY39203.1 transporter substrate-binding domain-containing protein [Marinagarivorans sp.]